MKTWQKVSFYSCFILTRPYFWQTLSFFEIWIGKVRQDFFPYIKTESSRPHYGQNFRFLYKNFEAFLSFESEKKYDLITKTPKKISLKLFTSQWSLRVFIHNSTSRIVFQCPHDSGRNIGIDYDNLTNWRFMVFRHFFW